jgi:uncharacterized protein DUF3147
MQIKIDLSALKRTRWQEYVTRFLFGGAVTVAAGLIANQFGPVVGGLFLAVPAIFPASATLLEKHQTEKKQRAGITDQQRGRKAVALDARGAAIGCVGLVAFGSLVWQLIPAVNTWLCLTAALAVWLGLSTSIWRLSKYFRKRRRA